MIATILALDVIDDLNDSMYEIFDGASSTQSWSTKILTVRTQVGMPLCRWWLVSLGSYRSLQIFLVDTESYRCKYERYERLQCLWHQGLEENGNC